MLKRTLDAFGDSAVYAVSFDTDQAWNNAERAKRIRSTYKGRFLRVQAADGGCIVFMPGRAP